MVVAAFIIVSPMQNPCMEREDDASARRPMVMVTPTPAPVTVTGNSDYYVVALIRAADGTVTVSTIDGSAYASGNMLTFSSPVITRVNRGSTYAFYLARKHVDGEDQGDRDDQDEHGDQGQEHDY